MCGEHGGDPPSIEFFERVGLDYVSCSPNRVPTARLAAAQATVRARDVKIDTAFVPAEAADTTVAIVIDVLRATTTITCALGQGYERVLACGELDEARELAGRLGEGSVLAGERKCVRPEGFDLGNSPRDFDGGAPLGANLVLTTTNGTRAIVAADAHADSILIGCLINLRACAAAAARLARQHEGAVLVQCAGVKGALTMDDAYTAGRFVTELTALLPGLGADRRGAGRRGASRRASTPPWTAWRHHRVPATCAAASLYDDVEFCARESVLERRAPSRHRRRRHRADHGLTGGASLRQESPAGVNESSSACFFLAALAEYLPGAL